MTCSCMKNMLPRPFPSAVLQSPRIVPCFFLAVVPLLLFFWRFALADHLDSLLHARQQLRTDKGWGDPCAICVTQWSIYRCLRMMFHARVLDISWSCRFGSKQSKCAMHLNPCPDEELPMCHHKNKILSTHVTTSVLEFAPSAGSQPATKTSTGVWRNVAACNKNIYTHKLLWQEKLRTIFLELVTQPMMTTWSVWSINKRRLQFISCHLQQCTWFPKYIVLSSELNMQCTRI